MPRWKRLNGLFLPAWRSPDLAVRRRAAMGLSADDPESLLALEVLIQDSAAPVREAAIKRVRDLTLLRAYMSGDSDPTVRSAAGVRYRQRLIGDCDAATVAAELTRCHEASIVAHVAQQGRAASVRAAAIDHLNDAGVLSEIALHDAEPANRRRAVERIDSAAVLERLMARAASFAPDTAEWAAARLTGERSSGGGAAAESAGGAATAERSGPQAAPPRGDPSTPLPTRASPAQPGGAALPPHGPAAVSPPSAAPTNRPRADEATALCTAMEGLAAMRWRPQLQRRRRELVARWRRLQPAPPRALAVRFRTATLSVLLHRPPADNPSGKIRRALQHLLDEATAPGGSGVTAALEQRFVVLTRDLDRPELCGDHPDAARARLLRQRLAGVIARAGQAPPREAAAPKRVDQAPIGDALVHLLEAAEAAAHFGDYATVGAKIQAARRLVESTAETYAESVDMHQVNR